MAMGSVPGQIQNQMQGHMQGQIQNQMAGQGGYLMELASITQKPEQNEIQHFLMKQEYM
jgi:hypothetical protein